MRLCFFFLLLLDLFNKAKDHVFKFWNLVWIVKYLLWVCYFTCQNLLKSLFKVSQRCLVSTLGIKINYSFLKKLIDDSTKNTNLDKTLINCIVLLVIEFLYMFRLWELLRGQFSQDDIFRIASVGLKMGGYSHSCALILEVYHILYTRVKVDVSCAQLWEVMATEMPSDIGGLLSNVASLIVGPTSLCIAYFTAI